MTPPHKLVCVGILSSSDIFFISALKRYPTYRTCLKYSIAKLDKLDIFNQSNLLLIFAPCPRHRSCYVMTSSTGPNEILGEKFPSVCFWKESRKRIVTFHPLSLGKWSKWSNLTTCTCFFCNMAKHHHHIEKVWPRFTPLNWHKSDMKHCGTVRV